MITRATQSLIVSIICIAATAPAALIGSLGLVVCQGAHGHFALEAPHANTEHHSEVCTDHTPTKTPDQCPDNQDCQDSELTVEEVTAQQTPLPDFAFDLVFSHTLSTSHLNLSAGITIDAQLQPPPAIPPLLQSSVLTL